MAKTKDVMTKIYWAVIGATIWKFLEKQEWIVRMKENLVYIQTIQPERPAHLMWQVIATIIAITLFNRGVMSLKKQFSAQALIIVIITLVWLGLMLIVVSTAVSLTAGGNPVARMRFLNALYRGT